MPSDQTPASTPVEIIIQSGARHLRWRELWEYRELLGQFVRRDLVTKYRQTLLGPLWYVLQPLMTAAVFYVVFGRIAGLSTDNTPRVLFYLCGLLSWTYFGQTMPTIAGTFSGNAYLFGKIYFPRLVVPLSVMLGNLPALALQFATFGALWIYYRLFTDFGLRPVTSLPAALGLLLLAQVQIMLLALGLGGFLAAATGKYRDLQHAIPIFMQLWFYATPIVYPLSMISREASWRWVASVNPMTAPAEAMKLALVGQSSWTPQLALGAWGITLVFLLLGLFAFSRAERTVVDIA